MALVSLERFEQQVKELEGVLIDILLPKETIVDSYDHVNRFKYKATLKELFEKRIYPKLKGHSPEYKFSTKSGSYLPSSYKLFEVTGPV